MSYDVLIIGAGMSGLAAGLRLAYFEKKVCVIEKHSRAGGLNSYYLKGGYDFDVGLHAMTNYVEKGARDMPLSRLLRQLRIRYEELDLNPQKRSSIRFNDHKLSFSNDFQLLESEIANKFPNDIDGFKSLVCVIQEYNELDLTKKPQSSRKLMELYISSPLLIDMLLCPLMFYGNPKEDDMDLWQFVIMFKSIFLQGFARPYDGVRRIIKLLLERFNEYGGELKLKCGVTKIVRDSNGFKVETDSGEVLRAKKIISSAGCVETARLISGGSPLDEVHPGVMSYMESIYILDKEPETLGFDDTIVFYNSAEKFEYKKPKTLIDATSGVICSPNNFEYDRPLKENIVRITNISNYDLWNRGDKDAYSMQKEECMKRALLEVQKYASDISGNIVYSDSFTPKTIERFTSHAGGAVYGIAEKIKSGLTGIDGLYLCGTDQGYLGIVGAVLSGITVANLYALK